MSKEELYHRLMIDLETIKMPINEVEISIRPYSKTYYGRYFTSGKIYLYPYKSKSGTLFTYEDIFSTAVHEMCHHIQHQDPTFKRVKGVMHDPKFWCLYNHFIDRADRLNIIRKEAITHYGS